MEGAVEKDFIHPVLLGETILPYRLFSSLEGVIPVTEAGEMLDSRKAADAGFAHLSAWMERAEEAWNRFGKGKRSYIAQLNYISQLSAQFPIATRRVVYAASGSLPAATIIRDPRAVIEHKLYWSAPQSDEEALYLVGTLNSETARSQAERYQSRGQFGARDFDKVMFNLPIPRFDATTALHRDLADAGAEAERVAASVTLEPSEKFVKARQRVRRALAEDGIGPEIEKLVEKLLDG